MYQRVLAEDADTFGDVASRVGIRYTRGTGLYRLLKAESVSAEKKMVLYNVSTGAFETDDVRQKLGVNAKAKSVTIKPADVPAGYELYVQSTSPNRKLPAGHVLLEAPAGSAVVSTTTTSSASSKVSSSRKPPAKKRKRNDDDDEDEDDDEADDDAKPEGFINWKILEGLNENVDEPIDDQELVVRNGSLEFCDEKVPEGELEALHDQIVGVLRTVTDWRDLQRITLAGNAGEKIQWHSTKHGCRLFYFNTDDLSVIALERKNVFGVVFGVGGGHPFIQTNVFGYCNSDGSSYYAPPLGRLTVDKLLIQLSIKIMDHGHDNYH